MNQKSPAWTKKNNDGKTLRYKRNRRELPRQQEIRAKTALSTRAASLL